MTQPQKPYTYTVLRYVHDVTTGEFINVGLVLHVPAVGLLKVKTRQTIGRIKDVFPNLDRHAFVSSMKAVERAIAIQAKEIENAGLFTGDFDAGAYARRAIPIDYSSLQWSPMGAGLTSDPDKTFERIYARFIAKYDVRGIHRRTDEDVWRPVREKLAERKVAVTFEKKAIVGSSDVISFDRAWRNGVWHAYEPVSLDLADADGIKDKARRWLGHLAAVGDRPSDPFKVYFILGRPQAENLFEAYEQAKGILSKAPGNPAIFEEDEVEALVEEIEDEYRAHSGS